MLILIRELHHSRRQNSQLQHPNLSSMWITWRYYSKFQFQINYYEFIQMESDEIISFSILRIIFHFCPNYYLFITLEAPKNIKLKVMYYRLSIVFQYLTKINFIYDFIMTIGLLDMIYEYKISSFIFFFISIFVNNIVTIHNN